MDRQKALQERFGDRLVLRNNYAEKLPSITDRVVKNAKQSQLDPYSKDKWGHDRYDGPYRDKKPTINPEVESSDEQVEEKQAPKKTSLNKVLVRGLPSDITKVQVESIFNRYGEVKKAQVEEGFAIVTFQDNEGALQAHYITTHKKLLKINGNQIKVTVIEDDDKSA